MLVLPFLYVILVEKKDLAWLGFRTQHVQTSICQGLLTTLFLMGVYYPIFLHYSPTLSGRFPSLYDVFTDVVWYPVYEEVAYRSFLLVHFARADDSPLSRRNLTVNLIQSSLFLFVHKHHVAQGTPLILIPVLLLALLNGYVFLKTRNISGCLLSHSAVNGFALLLHLFSSQ